MITIPSDCPRGLDSCIALASIISDDKSSFFCCGENDGSDRSIKQDKYTTCFKGEGDDRRSHSDKRDLVHEASVIIQALAVIEAVDGEEDWSAWEKSENE